MVKRMSPCYKCEDRFVGCHDKCEKYQVWSGEMREAKQNYAIAIDEKNYVICMRIKDKIKRYKKNGSWR